MQELKFVVADSDASSLVLRAVDPAVGGPIAEYFLPVTDELRSFLSDAPTASAGSASVEAEVDSHSETSEASEGSGSDTTSADSTAGPADAAKDAAEAHREEEQAATRAEEEAVEAEVASLFKGRAQDRPNARPHRTKISMLSLIHI